MQPSTPASSDLDAFVAWYSARRRRTKGRGPSTATLRTKRQHLRTCLRETETPSLEALSTHLSERINVEHLLDRLSARMEMSSMQPVIYALLDLAEFARAREWALSAVTRADVPAGGPPKPITVYTAEELDLFVGSAKGVDVRWWALLSFLAYSGRRIGDALALEWDWLKLESSPPYFELPYQKNGNPQYIPLGKTLRKVFTSDNIHWMQTHGRATLRRSAKEYVFPGSYSTYYAQFGRFCERTGLPNRGFHHFRHTFITQKLVEGVPIQAVSALVGHSNPSITGKRYNHVTAMNFGQYLD